MTSRKRDPVPMNSFEVWTPVDDEIALRWRAEGRSWRDIADELGRSIHAVRARVLKLESRQR